MRRLALALLVVAPAAATAALGPRYGGDLTVSVVSLPASTDPAVPAGAADALVGGLVHETLVGIGPDGLPTPGLARGWSTAAAGREWTLRLADGASFHDDRPVTADDAVRSLRRFLRSASTAAARLAEALEGGAAFRARTTDELPGLAAPDSGRVVLRFVDLRPLPLAPLASPAAAVTSATGSGCGPFVPTLAVPGRRIGLTAFGGHVRGRPYLDAVQISTTAESSARRADLQAGRADSPTAEGPSAVAATLLLVLDAARPPFDRAEARSAVAGAIDRIDLVRHFLPGGDPTPVLLAPALLPPLATDPPPAPARLAGTVTMTVSTDVPPLVSQRVVASLGAIGLSATVAPASPATAVTAPSPIRLLLFLPEVAEPGLALDALAALAPADPAVRDALAAAARTGDLDRRRALLHRAEAALRDGRVLVPIAVAPIAFAARRGVHGATVDAAGRLLLEDAWVEP